MKLKEFLKAFFSPSEDVHVNINEVIESKVWKLTKEQIHTHQLRAQLAEKRAEQIGEMAHFQIESLQKMYTEMLTECHKEIVRLKMQIAENETH